MKLLLSLILVSLALAYAQTTTYTPIYYIGNVTQTGAATTTNIGAVNFDILQTTADDYHYNYTIIIARDAAPVGASFTFNGLASNQGPITLSCGTGSTYANGNIQCVGNQTTVEGNRAVIAAVANDANKGNNSINIVYSEGNPAAEYGRSVLVIRGNTAPATTTTAPATTGAATTTSTATSATGTPTPTVTNATSTTGAANNIVAPTFFIGLVLAVLALFM